jgi:membrane dipeptidase
MAGSLHEDAIVIDGLIIANFSRAVFADMRKGGLTAANCTCAVWEGFRGAMDNIARWQRWFGENEDLIVPVHSTADIARAKREGRTGIILGWQNLSGIEDRIEYLGLFKALGVGIMQIAYNTQNLVGSGCYETEDGGLSDFGREVIHEMNRLGILCDLSHVGARTSEAVIRHSKKPVAYTHVLPAGLKAHPRNKSDAELRFIAEHGGFVGVTMFPPFLAQGSAATVDDFVAAIEYVVDRVGDERVGVGTDFTQDQDAAFFDYLCRDKGTGRRVVSFGEIVNPAGFRTIGAFPNLTRAMERRGWPEARIRGVIGGNWLRFLAETWGE